jgi:hypothetical protein
VDGQVSTIPDQTRILLGQTADYDRLPVPLLDAQVTLYDDHGNSYSYIADEYVQGQYVLKNFVGIPGTSYHVKIVIPSGEEYLSAPEKLPESTNPFSTRYEVTNEEYTDFEGTVSTQPFVKIFCNVSLPPSEQPRYLKWFIQEDFLLSPTDFPDPFNAIPPPCYIAQNADPQTLVLIDESKINTSSIENMVIGSRIVDWTFLERHYFTTYQSSLTKEAFEYWRKVDILANQVGSIFDTPPAKIVGNITNVNDANEEVLGYVMAVNQTMDRFYIMPYDFPFPLLMEPCTYYNYKYDYLPRCLDCTSVRNSSYRRPDWF